MVDKGNLHYSVSEWLHLLFSWCTTQLRSLHTVCSLLLDGFVGSLQRSVYVKCGAVKFSLYCVVAIKIS